MEKLLFSHIDDKLRRLQAKRPFTQGELERLREQFLVENTYNSNAIEGNTLTLRETDLVLRGLTVDKKPLKDHLEATAHKDAFLYVCDLVSEPEPLNEKTIKEIHSLVLADRLRDKGAYRQIPVRIVGAKTTPAPPLEIADKMAQLLQSYHQDTAHIVSKLAKFHVLFEGIHPFVDGNGRCGRLLVNLELMKAGYPPIDIKFADRRAYYDAFDAYFETANLEPMEQLFATYVNSQLDAYLELLGE